MHLAPRPEFDFQGLWFHRCAHSGNAATGLVKSQAVLHVILATEESGPPGPGTGGGTKPSRGNHIGFEVDDFDSARQHLAQRNVPIIHGPKQRPDGVNQLYLRDPDGHVIELFGT